jgi:hypothetical protein
MGMVTLSYQWYCFSMLPFQNMFMFVLSSSARESGSEKTISCAGAEYSEGKVITNSMFLNYAYM